ncbi:CYFA0S05e02630g1_1 [Cyberlindnera fabianii]|uniref:GTPase-activating protein GYP7 n=1 Tax=Cyberlindnera fabianii TaxID=36022 RepID=A0A061B0U7_CYBFA|nr:CYFA0S05e02630g1_1 [Cyberlindnera fabianii]
MSYPLGKVKLLYVKAKVYVHPDKNAGQNFDGFLYMCAEQGATDKDIIVGWAPRSVLNEEDIAMLEQVDLNGPTDTSFIKRLPAGGSFSFQVSIGQLFSLERRPPTLGWWSGSVVIHSRVLSDKIPVLFFHDEESESTMRESAAKNKNFDPFGEENELYWGGVTFFEKLKEHCHLEKATLEPKVLLVNPTLEDLNNFSSSFFNQDDQKTPGISFNGFLDKARVGLYDSFVKIGSRARASINKIVQESPAPLQEYLKNPEVQKVNEDFDAARVYLAKWALGVQEQAEKSRQKIILDNQSRQVLSKELGMNFDKLLPGEILNAHERREVSKQTWDSFFDHAGCLCLTVHEVKERIFHGGLNETIRGEAWLFLLEVYPWDSSYAERKDLRMVLKKQYEEMKGLWRPKLEHGASDSYFQDQKFRIEKDIQRTDRNMEIYKNHDDGGNDKLMSSNVHEDDSENVAVVKNKHLRALREILLTFNEYNDKLGYVQGMTDLLSPLYVVLQDESMAFWAFVKFMDRMERNFLHDQHGMKDQMNALNELVQFMLPDLFIHLQKCDSTDLFFFFRMLLVWFKREMPWNDVLRLWEVLWTDFYSSQFHLFFALAILQKNEKIVTEHLTKFDEVLKYFNDLSMTYNLNDLLTRSELLFLKFRKMVEIMDKEEGKSAIGDQLRQLLSKDMVIQRETERHDG